MTVQLRWGVCGLGAALLFGCVRTAAPAAVSSARPELATNTQGQAPVVVVAHEPEPTTAAPAVEARFNAFPNTKAPYTLIDIPNPYEDVMTEERRGVLRGAAERVMAAPVDPSRLETQMVTFSSGGTRCSVLGADGLCVRTMDGPFILTDFAALGPCKDALFLGSAPVKEQLDAQMREQPLWLIPVKESGAFGTRLYIAAGERLIALIKPAGKALAKDPHCAITWSGFRPRMLPARGE
jgi:hypothetical protein